MCFRLCLLVAAFSAVPIAASAEWKAVEEVKPYSISGTSGAALYASIGERGPSIDGRGRTIAHTTFKLTWTRKYEPQAGACVLVSARPKLTITYTLPKPAQTLPAPTRVSWERFIAGIAQHEHVHGDHIKDMVREIEAMSVGLSAADDADCRKIRVELTKRLGELSARQRERSREFDRVEMSEGGNIRQLILALVNGP
jgi:predicted secreted Zn-dependent protease